MKKITKAGLVVLGGVAIGVTAASKKIKEIVTSDETKEKIENCKTQAKKFQHIAECQGKKIVKETAIKARNCTDSIFNKIDNDLNEDIEVSEINESEEYIEGFNKDVDCPMDCSCTECKCNQQCVNTDAEDEDDKDNTKDTNLKETKDDSSDKKEYIKPEIKVEKKKDEKSDKKKSEKSKEKDSDKKSEKKSKSTKSSKEDKEDKPKKNTTKKKTEKKDKE